MNTISITVPPKILQCRTCLSFNLANGHAPISNVETFLKLYCNIQISANDDLPTEICNTCLAKLEKVYEFVKLCKNSDMALRKKLNHKHLCNVKNSKLQSVQEFDIQHLESGSNSIENYDKRDKKVVPKRDSQRCEIKQNPDNSCLTCGKIFSSFSRLKVHLNIHSRKGSHLCKICGKEFTFPENLSRHYRIHSGDKKYTCKICSKSFIQSGELKSHMVSHTSEKIYLCNYCGNTFARKLSLKVHIRRIHSTRLQSFLCHFCGKVFKDQRDLGQHKLIHAQERNHICSVCNKAFNRKSNLVVHIRTHTGLKPHSCELCEKGFTQKHALNKHIQRMHNLTTT